MPDPLLEDPRARLVGSLFRHAMPLALGGGFGLMIGLGSAARSGGTWPLAWTGLFLLVTAGRLGLVWAYRRAAARGKVRPGLWGRLYLAGGVASCLMVGAVCAVCLLMRDADLSLLSLALVVGMAAILAYRNAGMPGIAVAQIIATGLPAVAGLLLTGAPWQQLLGVESAVYFVMLCFVVWQNHGQMRHLMQTEAENAALLTRFRHQAEHDPLTGLANRARFVEGAAAALAGLPEGGRPAALYLDLDGFKEVNDRLGHAAGDALLRCVADALRRETRDGDVVARLGGDEFAVVRPRAACAEAEALAGRLAAAITRAHELEPGCRVRAGVSIGVALVPDGGCDADELLRRADTALYAAKSGRKGSYRLFDAAMQAEALARRDLEAELRAAVEAGRGLELHYQPILDALTGAVVAREALLRWRRPGRGLAAPAEFIPQAEASGVIVPLGEWVLRRACADAAGWTDGARVAVNVSPLQLGREPRFADLVRGALARSGLPAARLEVEITESALLGSDPAMLADLRALRAAGVSVALDDFGTGFSSLARLRDFTFDRIKIDGSFVRDAARRPDCAAIVRAVAELGRRLGVATVAEGVETPEQLALVRDEGCGEVQGFLLGRPQPPEELPGEPPGAMQDAAEPVQAFAARPGRHPG